MFFYANASSLEYLIVVKYSTNPWLWHFSNAGHTRERSSLKRRATSSHVTHVWHSLLPWCSEGSCKREEGVSVWRVTRPHHSWGIRGFCGMADDLLLPAGPMPQSMRQFWVAYALTSLNQSFVCQLPRWLVAFEENTFFRQFLRNLTANWVER